MPDNLSNVKKYFNYFFETRGYTPNGFGARVSEAANQTAYHARGKDRGPAVFIHGIMPRSGTVYIGELLRLHPDLCAYPNQIWEFPALTLADDVIRLQEKFLEGYRMNEGKLEEQDFLPVVGGALMAYLHAATPPGKRVLVKMPSVQFLDRFFAMFPYENLLILVRDGRDLVHSTLRTWKQLNFIQVCLRWNRSARMTLSTINHLEEIGQSGFLVTKYEDALQDPITLIKRTCQRLDLDESKYPFDKIESIRVIGSSKLENKGKVRWRHIDRPKEFRPLEYWKDWPAYRKTLFKMIAGKSLMELGYCEDLNW